MLKKTVKKIISGISRETINLNKDETQLLAIGTLLSNQQHSLTSVNINDYEFKIFSQFGDDGIIQYILKHIKIHNETFIEFGVGDYSESNTRFLLMNNNWTGFVMDGSLDNIDHLIGQPWFWQYQLTAKAVFIDRDNINNLLAETGMANIGLLHIDLDGNDYYLLKELDFKVLNPSILILEYNSVFGKERSIAVPYDKDFYRTNAHYSNLFFGASLPALTDAANEKGYALVGCNRAGNNAYFIRRDLLTYKLKELTIDEAYIESKYRESRDETYQLTYLCGKERVEAIKGLEVINTKTGQREKI